MGTAGVGPQALCAHKQRQPTNFPSSGAVTVSALSSGPRWSICFQSSSTSRRVQGWLQTLFPVVLIPIPGGFLCLENRTPPSPGVLNYSTNNTASATLIPEDAAAVSCLPVLTNIPTLHPHSSILCAALAQCGGSPGGHSSPTLSQIMWLLGGVGAAPHPGCASPSAQRLRPNPG